MRLMIVGNQGKDVTTASGIAAGRGVLVRHRTSVAEAMQDLRDGRGADLLLVDVRLDIAKLIEQLTVEHFWLPVIAFGIETDPRAAVAAIKAGAKDFMPLPPDPELIAAILESIASDNRDLVCQDQRMLNVLRLARQYATADANLLISGESGTGKEMVARFVHHESKRSNGPFVSVNCAAIPENLLESELFGHEKGAFTGALTRRIGKFEEANGGTLLLDEISEMETRLQAKLLRAIQEREIDRVGGAKPIRVDIRLIATSNRDLEKSVREGVFREDLLFRLNVLELRLPPLRERPADIEALARHFATKFTRINGMPDRDLSAAALEKLRACAWKGNVRELENCLHRAVLLAQGSEIGPEAIVATGQSTTPYVPAAPTLPARTREVEPGGGLGVGRTIADVERDLILGTLRQTLGNRTHAAGILGISIRTLRNKLKQYSDEGVAVPPPAGEHALQG